MTRHRYFLNGKGYSGIKRYFDEHLSSGLRKLMGKTWNKLGMESREVSREVFDKLEGNLHPVTGERLTARMNTTRMENGKEVDNRRSGMDLCFNCPKTLSEVWMENPGEFADQIMAVFLVARDKAMVLAEELACTGRGDEKKVTGNLLYMSVVHEDARPVGMNVPDPHLHCHNFIFNVTWDAEEGRFKAVETRDIVKYAETIDAVFMSELEKGLSELGIGTERTPDGRSFEITGVFGKDIFSKRRNEILKYERQHQDKVEILTKMEIREAKRKGKTLDYDRVKANVRIRIGNQLSQRKKQIPVAEKLAALRAQMTPEIKESLQKRQVLSAPRKDWLSPEEAKREVLFSAFKNYSVAHEFKIAATLLRSAGGKMGLNEALDYARSGAFIRLDDEGHVTTEEVKREEDEMRKTVREGWDQCQPVKWDVVDEKFVLALDQLRAIRFILNSKDRYMNVSGIAGAGKTTLLKETVRKLDEQKITYVMLAPTSASEKKLKEDFPDAMTLQGFEKAIEGCGKTFGVALPKGSFIFVDESSIVSVPQMARLTKWIKENDCRLVTLGDSAQHNAPERGDAMRILEESKSIRGEALKETYRAKVKHLKQSVLDLKAGGKRREKAFNSLQVHGDIKEIEDINSLREAALATHMDVLRAGKVSILACPVHEEARAMAEVVRETLKREGKLGGDYDVMRLQRIDKEKEELKDPLYYQPGRVIIFRSKVFGGFKPGEKWTVIDRFTQENEATFKVSRGNEIRYFRPCSPGEWGVYEPSWIRLADGDQVRVTEGFKGYRGDKFKNNDILKVKQVLSNSIEFEDGRVMDRDLVHLDQGYCVTSYATQCRTVYQMVALAPILSLRLLSAKTFYVLASRATHRAVFYTDCTEGLREAVLRKGERISVYDFSKEQEIAKAKEIAYERIRRTAHSTPIMSAGFPEYSEHDFRDAHSIDTTAGEI